MLLSLMISHSYLSLAALAAATLHEIGHLTAAKLCGVPIKELRLSIFGAAITLESGLYSYKKELLMAAAGPLVNILTVSLMIPNYPSLREPWQLFLIASAFLGTLNLLPITDFDGGRIFFCICSQFASPKTASALCGAASFITVLTLWMASVYLLLRFGTSLSLFVFSSALFCKIFTPRNS